MDALSCCRKNHDAESPPFEARSTASEAREQLGEHDAGARVTKPGKPFHPGKYPGWFIPCTLQMGDGSRERIRLALRNDNSAGSWVVDGGL